MGENAVFENAITLDALYGYPIVRGSAAKGMTRAWAKYWQGADDAEIRKIFGQITSRGGGHKGAVTFVGGIPTQCGPAGPLELDIMTPHYRNYYSDASEPPADWCNPSQIYFVAVAAGVAFCFHLVGSEPALVETAARWHQEALANIGIGAKTAAGYGYFERLEKSLISGEGVSWSEVAPPVG